MPGDIQATSNSTLLPPLHFPTHWPSQSELLSWCHAVGPGESALLILVGVIFLLFGINLFKVLVMINMAFIGAIIGAMIGQRTGNEVPGAIVGATTCALIAIPFMKYAVALMGGMFGLVVGASLWRASSLQPDLIWAGGLCGCLLFGLLSFVIFKVCVMTYTSLQGALMIVIGALGLILKYPSISTTLRSALTHRPFILPVAVFIPTMLGLIYQHSGPTMVAKPAAGKK